MTITDEIERTLAQDPVMAELLEKHDPYSERDWAEFERLCISIINQQLSTASALAVRERVFDLLEDEVTPETVLAADEDALREAGLSRTKVEYVQNAARAFQRNDFTREGLADHSDEEVIDLLTEIKGVGEWTARMYLLFVLDRQDVLPLGDLAVRRGIERLYGNGDGDEDEVGEMTRAEMREIAESWRPYRSIATLYIWAEYESDT
ncbi:DNA-3-methyladenine glycosylase 2 family protein [Halobacteria archaeon AArc-m2/3/4]|uniref:DNA-3-methyladenine glycosylase 2 family protein n=1 Tax=Natronoglomus mannanivorans TaxID=2979990 RepID=A0ABT2Q9X3_9EURY|nr:DNA-3-methyladenine glycosylase 2 family protein [Halobacteria archaeon AArc-m2/3/4]